MKIQIIYLDPQDDYFSARDKMSWVKSPRLLLVWPRRGTVLNRRLDLVLLQREAQQFSTQLGLVCFDPDVLAFAAELHIPVFQSIDDTPDSIWISYNTASSTPSPSSQRPEKKFTPVDRTSQREKKSAGRNISIRWGLFSVTLLALAFLSLALIPSANIRLYPSTVFHTEEVILDLSLTDASAPLYAVAGNIETLRLQTDEVVPASGTVEVPSETATGEVVFTNRTESQLTIPAGTGVRPRSSSPRRYETTQRAILAAGEGNQITVPVESSTPGTDGNLDADMITAIEGDLAFSAQVSNPLPLTGGTNQIRTGVSTGDMQFAQDVALESIIQAALPELENNLLSPQFLVHDLVSVGEIFETVFDHTLGTATDFLSIHLEAEVNAVVINRPSLESSLRRILTSALPENVNLLEITHIELLGDQDLMSQLRVSVEYSTLPEIDASRIRAAIHGRPILIAEEYLSNHYSMEQVPDLSIRPEWLPWLPFLEARINIVQLESSS